MSSQCVRRFAPKSAIAILEHFPRDPHPQAFPTTLTCPLVKLAGVRVAQNGVSLYRASRSLI